MNECRHRTSKSPMLYYVILAHPSSIWLSTSVVPLIYKPQTNVNIKWLYSLFHQSQLHLPCLPPFPSGFLRCTPYIDLHRTQYTRTTIHHLLYILLSHLYSLPIIVAVVRVIFFPLLRFILNLFWCAEVRQWPIVGWKTFLDAKIYYRSILYSYMQHTHTHICPHNISNIANMNCK